MSGQDISMESRFAIYIPSKGRAFSALTCRALDAACLSYFVVTTPEEAPEYAASYQGKVLALQYEGMRIGQVRNLILDDAVARGYEWIWMLDDDIRYLVHATASGKERCTFSVLAAIEQQLRACPVTQAGLCPNPHAIRAGETLSWNGVINQMMAFSLPRLGTVRFDETLFFCEDVDMTIKLLLDGHLNVRTRSYGYGIHYNGPSGAPYAGGLQETYKTHALLDSMRVMVERYPGIVSLGEISDGTKTLHITWATFRTTVPRMGVRL
jgi:hypothetical protein